MKFNQGGEMTKIMLQPEALQAVLPHVSDDESRPMLKHVFLRAGGTAIATNGHTLGAHHVAHDSLDDVLMKFPKGAATVLRQAAKRGYPVIVDTETKIAQCFEISKTFVVEIHEPASAFPKFLQVLPSTKEKFHAIGAISLNTEYMMRFGEKATFYFNAPDRPVVVQTFGDPHFYGLLMPLRSQDDELAEESVWSKGVPHLPPRWLLGKEESVAEETPEESSETPDDGKGEVGA